MNGQPVTPLSLPLQSQTSPPLNSSRLCGKVPVPQCPQTREEISRKVAKHAKPSTSLPPSSPHPTLPIANQAERSPSHSPHRKSKRSDPPSHSPHRQSSGAIPIPLSPSQIKRSDSPPCAKLPAPSSLLPAPRPNRAGPQPPPYCQHTPRENATDPNSPTTVNLSPKP